MAYKNPWFKVMSRGSFYTIEYDRPQVVVLPVLEDTSVVMVRVQRPLIDDSPLELPAGDSNDNETPVMAGIREFVEETGIHIKDPSRFHPELPISELPGRMPVLLSIFRVDVSRSEFDNRGPHDGEIVSVEAIPYSEIVKKLIEGQIYLSSPMAILSRFLLKKTFACIDSAEGIR
jgi:8-oxo-dGTP pyrophosphatase MutT (NUDIX family)